MTASPGDRFPRRTLHRKLADQARLPTPRYLTRLSATSTALLLLRSVPVGVLEDIYEGGTGLKARAVLCARGDLVSLARLVGCGLVVHRQVQPPGDHYAPLPAVGVRRHLDLLDSAEEDHLAVRARYQPTFDLRERYIHFGHVLHPGRIWVHKNSFTPFCSIFPGISPIISRGSPPSGRACAPWPT